MAGRKPRRRRKPWGSFLGEDPGDGLEINRINDARFASRKGRSVSMFDADNICIEYEHKRGGRRFHRVSIMGEVRHANASKTRKINGYKERIKGR